MKLTADEHLIYLTAAGVDPQTAIKQQALIQMERKQLADKICKVISNVDWDAAKQNIHNNTVLVGFLTKLVKDQV